MRSSRKYKENIEPAFLDSWSVYDLTPVTFNYKDLPEDRFLGLIAEDAEAAGLEDIVVRRNGQVDGIRYDLLSVALLAVVKEQEERITALEVALDYLIGNGNQNGSI